MTMQKIQTFDGRPIYLITKTGRDTCSGCMAGVQMSGVCKALPPCGDGDHIWTNEAGYVKWVAEVRMT